MERTYFMQPYEKFKKHGPQSLSDAELLAVIIRTGTKDFNSVAVGEAILKLFPGLGLTGLFHMTIGELLKIPGIGEVKAIKMKCIAELALRISQTEAQKKLKFSEPSTVAGYYMESMRHLDQERVILLMLDSKLRLIREEILSIGTVSESMLSPREVFLRALREEAVSILLLHNHPSGDPSPSRQDIEITRRIQQLGLLLNIPLTDHIIIGDKCYRSMKETGIL